MPQYPTFPRSHLLIIGPNSTKSLLPVTPISQVETLLETHRIEDAIQLADQQRKKVQSRLVLDPTEVRLVLPTPLSPLILKLLQAVEQAYVYQRIGFQCLLETRFEDAGFCLFQGELDPRILISYFPEFRGALLDENPTIDVFSGIAECMPPYDSIDDISTSLFRDPLPAILPFPHLRTLAMTHSPLLCRRLTFSRRQLSHKLFTLPRTDYSFGTTHLRAPSYPWTRSV